MRPRLELALGLSALVLTSCAPSLALVKHNFDNYESLVARLERLRRNYDPVVDFDSLGITHEARSILAVRVAGPMVERGAPALLAIFGEHGDEHDAIDLGVALIAHLAEHYGVDSTVTKLLDRKVLWIIPMMNPDGVEFDLSGRVQPFSWRKNRTPTGKSSWGVDLNRNWEPIWPSEVPSELARELSDRSSQYFAGDRPFSEPETQAVRDFLLQHPEVRMFVDYHSGFAPFVQGGVGFPIPPEKTALTGARRERLEELAAGVAEAVSDEADGRHAFVVSKERDVAKTIRPLAPWWARVFVPESIPPAPGTSGEWVYGELAIPAIGIEMMRDWGYFRAVADAKKLLLENQARGLIFLLEELSHDPFRIP